MMAHWTFRGQHWAAKERKEPLKRLFVSRRFGMTWRNGFYHTRRISKWVSLSKKGAMREDMRLIRGFGRLRLAKRKDHRGQTLCVGRPRLCEVVMKVNCAFWTCMWHGEAIRLKISPSVLTMSSCILQSRRTQRK